MKLDPLSVHDTTLFLAQVGVVLAVARLLGSAVHRLGQPAVLGYVAGGVVLGPTLLGGGSGPTVALFPRGATAGLVAVAVLGQVFVLATTGLHVDPSLVRRWVGRAPALALSSLVVPLVAGGLFGYALPASYRGPEASANTFALLMAIALAISSPPVISLVLGDLGLLRRDFAQVTLAVAMTNDVVGWVLLSIVAALAGSGEVPIRSLAITVLATLFFIGSLWRGGPRLAQLLLRAGAGSRRHHPELAAGLVIVFGLAATSSAIGIEAVLGAFAAGLILGGRPEARQRVEPPLQAVTDAWLAPLFFAVAGLRLDLTALADATVLAWATAAVLVATATKLLGAGVAARWSGSPPREAAAIAVGLNVRGSLEIVLAATGLALGVLNETSYTVVLVVAVVTSACAPPLLRRITAGWDGDQAERLRLRQERLLANAQSLPAVALAAEEGAGSPGLSIARSIWPGALAACTFTGSRAVVLPLDCPAPTITGHLTDGQATLVLVSPRARLPAAESGGTVVTPVTASVSAALAVEAATVIALANELPLRLVHRREDGGPVPGIDAALRWASGAGVTAEAVVVDDQPCLVTALAANLGPDDLLVTGSSARWAADRFDLGRCADAFSGSGNQVVVLVPPTPGLFLPAAWT